MIKKVEVWEKLAGNRWPILIEKRTYFLGMLVYKFVRVEFPAEELKTVEEEIHVGKGIVSQIEEAVKFESQVVANEVIEEAQSKSVKKNKFKKHNNNK